MADHKRRKLCVKRLIKLCCCTLLATVDDWSRVADQVHWETMVVAVRPMETLPEETKISPAIDKFIQKAHLRRQKQCPGYQRHGKRASEPGKKILSRLEFFGSMSLTKESHGVKIFHHCRMPHLISFAAHNICMDTRLD